MGRKAAERLWVNPRCGGGAGGPLRRAARAALSSAAVPDAPPGSGMGKRVLPCFNEMLSLMTCFKKNSFEDAKCQAEVRLLNACMAAQAKKPRETNTINHHLQRLSQAAKR